MATHELKIERHWFHEIQGRRKRCEVRKDDRGFRVGDVLILNEYDREAERYTGAMVRRIVSHILRDVPGVEAGYVVLSLVVGM